MILSYRQLRVPNVQPDFPVVRTMFPLCPVPVGLTLMLDKHPVQRALQVSPVTRDHPPAAERDITVLQ